MDMLFPLQAVKSRDIDYSHFISLPLAINPELVEKLVNFQNSILGNSGNNENLCGESSVDNSDDKDQPLDRQHDVAVELKVKDDSKHVTVGITNIPIKSYAPKTWKPFPSGMKATTFLGLKEIHDLILCSSCLPSDEPLLNIYSFGKVMIVYGMQWLKDGAARMGLGFWGRCKDGAGVWGV